MVRDSIGLEDPCQAGLSIGPCAALNACRYPAIAIMTSTEEIST